MQRGVELEKRGRLRTKKKKKTVGRRHLAENKLASFLLLLLFSLSPSYPSQPPSPDRSRVEGDLHAAVALALFGLDAAPVRLRLVLAAIRSATKAGAPAAAAAAPAAKARMPPSRRRSSAAASEAAAGACAWPVPRDDLLEVAARHRFWGTQKTEQKSRPF